MGNITAIEEPGKPSKKLESYRYDALHRLLEASYPEAASRRRYRYDAVGNRLERRIGEQAAHHYVYDKANQLLEVRSGSATGPVLFRFDHDKTGDHSVRQARNSLPQPFCLAYRSL